MELIKDDIDLSAYLDDDPAAHKVLPAGQWVEGVIDHFYKPDDTPRIRLPWKKVGNDFEFRGGEVTLWAGINGHGKSNMVGQVTLDLLTQQQRIVIASLEMSPVRTMARMSRQACGFSEPSVVFLRDFHRWTNKRLWLYDHVGSSDPRTVLAVVRYAIATFGVEHVLIDNLTKIVAGEDDYNGQKDFVNALCTIASATGVHIHLVAHVRKSKDENEVPNKFSIKGAGAISDMVDNVFIVWRNKAKERALRENDMSKVPDPDALLLLEKQRNGETENSYALWFHGESMQYIEDRHAAVKHYRFI